MGAVDGQVDVLRVPIKTRRPSERRLQGFHVRLRGWNRPVVTPVCVTLFAFRVRNRLDVDFVALRKHGAEVREYIGGRAVVDVAESNARFLWIDHEMIGSVLSFAYLREFASIWALAFGDAVTRHIVFGKLVNFVCCH